MSTPYGWAAGVDDEVCIANPDNPTRMLCRRWRGFVPVVPPAFPGRVHDECRELRESGGDRPPEPEPGACPECSGDIPLDGGKVAAHGMWVVGRHGVNQTDKPCPGEGADPEETS